MLGSPPAASLDEPRMSIPRPALIFRCQKNVLFFCGRPNKQSQKSPKASAVFEPSRNDSFIIGPLSSKEWFFNPGIMLSWRKLLVSELPGAGTDQNRIDISLSSEWPVFWTFLAGFNKSNLTYTHYYFWLYLHLTRYISLYLVISRYSRICFPLFNLYSRCWSIGLGPTSKRWTLFDRDFFKAYAPSPTAFIRAYSAAITMALSENRVPQNIHSS